MADNRYLYYNQTNTSLPPHETNNSQNGMDLWQTILAFSVSILIISIIILIFIIYKHRFNKNARKIKNPLVITFAITKFDAMPQQPEIEAILTDLNGINIDIQNINAFLTQEMNYHVVPKYKDKIEVYWAKKKLMHYLHQYSQHFTANIHKYDALMFILSGHSSRGYIITSDYKTISKNEIYGIFSMKHSKNESIPRLFVFNCYDNHNEANSNSRTEVDTPSLAVLSSETIPDDLPSKYNLVHDFSTMDRTDDNLVVIHAVKEQSYLIPQFMIELRKSIRRGASCCDCRNKLFLHEITEEIECKSMYNDVTETIVFNKSECKMEMSDIFVDDMMDETSKTKTRSGCSLDTMDKIWNEVVEMDDELYTNRTRAELNDGIDNDHHIIKTTDLLNHMEDALIEEEMMTNSISLSNYVITHKHDDKRSATKSQMSTLMTFDTELSENEEIP